MLLRRLSIASALILSLGGSVALLPHNSVLAQTPDQPGKTTRKDKEAWMQKLNLTADQKTKIQAIKAKYKPQMETKRQALKKAMEEKRALMKNAPADDQLRAKHKEIQALRQEMGNLSFESKLEMRKVLTPEQLKQLAEKEQNRKEKKECYHG
ncbi:MAG TPA: Spy/CpxP family protein refolding chaperone, partial [Allocoleopsis sp.]